MDVWTIYAHPLDFPDVPFLVRGWRLMSNGQTVPSGAVGFADTIEEARRMIPEGLVRFERNEGDDPVIVESWL